MTIYYHVAPASAVEDILTNGIQPLIKQFQRDEDAAIDAWMIRWAARMGREVEEVEGMIGEGRYDLGRVCVFQSLETARNWAVIEDGMVVIAIEDEDDCLTYDLTEDLSAADGEGGALSIGYGIEPRDFPLTVIA